MRSHPYTPAPPLPPLLDRLATYLPNAAGPRPPAPAAYDDEYRGGDDDDGAVALADLDPATSRLLPRRRRPHRFRVQGRLAVVRSVSVANLRTAPGSPRVPPSTSSSSTAASGLLAPPSFHSHAGSGRRRQPRRRRRSLDDGDEDASEEDEAAVREVQRKDAQLRSYGIGGAGNIRKSIWPTHRRPVSPAALPKC